MKRFLACLLLLALAACLSPTEADQAKDNVDQGTSVINAVLDALGLGQGKPIVSAGGELTKWVIGLLVGGSATAGAAVVQHVHGGLPFLGGRRRRKQQEDSEWDELLDDAEVLAQEAARLAPALGGKHDVEKRAAKALKIIGALQSKQQRPSRKKVPAPNA